MPREIERFGQPKDEPPAFIAARHVESGICLPARMQAESDAICSFVEIQIADARGDIASIDEYGGIHVRHHRDARFGVEEHQIAIVEAKVSVTSQRVVTAEAWLQIEWHELPLTRVG